MPPENRDHAASFARRVIPIFWALIHDNVGRRLDTLGPPTPLAVTMQPMKRTADLWPALFRAAVLAASALSIAAFLVVALARLAYPYEVEWVEGGLADEVAVILRGQMPYAAPSLQHVAFIYP